MKKAAVLLGLLLSFASASFAQNAQIQAIIGDISMDTMLHHLNGITGEIPVTVRGVEDTIFYRHSNNPDNELTFAYLIDELASYGLAVDSQAFNTNGQNVLAWQPGVLYPNSYYIICGHYDALGGPAADDDGSGTVAVLEAARIMSQYDFEYTILYAIWDEEEQGLQGSAAYAQAAGAMPETLLGVLNIDAIAWDGDADDLARVHTEPFDESEALADTVVAANVTYNIGLDLVINNPGATYSDHASFWNNGFPAVLIIEDFDNDPNPYYHTQQDKVEFLDLDYFEKLTKVSFAALASLAAPMPPNNSDQPTAAAAGMRLWPNPAGEQVFAELRLDQPAQVDFQLVNLAGQTVTQNTVSLGAGVSRLPLLDQALPAGVYVVAALATLSDGSQQMHLEKLIFME